jgi:hypothetical protein
MLRHQSLEPHAARRLEQARTDLTLLERRDEHAFGTALEPLGEPILALEQRLVAQIITADGDQIEGVKLRLVLVTARMQRVEVGIALQVEDANSRRMKR